MGAHGWVAGIASHGSVSLSRGWLISVEAPRHPGHLSSIQLDAAVKIDFTLSNARRFYSTKGDFLGVKGLIKLQNTLSLICISSK